MPDRAPVRMPLLLAPGNRDRSAGKDARLENGFVESQGKDAYHVYKRPGLALYGTFSRPSAEAGQGIYNMNGEVYTVFSNSLYRQGGLVGALTPQTSFTFSETQGANGKLFIKGPTVAYVYDPIALTLTQVTDVDYPASTVPGQAYLFGVTYVMDAQGQIYGSDVNDPASWDPLNLIVANIEPDNGVALAKQLTYVVALKQWSTEVFYDAGNPTGSRLTSVQGAKVNFGCHSADSLQDIDGDLFWISTTRNGSFNVVMMSDLKAQIISDSRIERLLEAALPASEVYSWGIKVFGHKLYGISSTAMDRTLVFDARERIWYEWKEGATRFSARGSASYLDLGLLQSRSTGTVNFFDPTSGEDLGALFDLTIYTPNFDGGVRLMKYLHRMDLVADQYAAGTLAIAYSEDDYQSWSTDRTFDLTQPRPNIIGCGSFRRRAWRIKHSATGPFRMEAIEFQLDLGTN